MNAQEIFDSSVLRLKSMKGQAAIPLNVGGVKPYMACQYRSPNGPCLVGAFIPDDVYSPKMDGGYNADGLIETFPELPQFMRDYKDLLLLLQAIHDDSSNWIDNQFCNWDILKNVIALEYSLNTEVLDNVCRV